jgi:hypothetical protein
MIFYLLSLEHIELLPGLFGKVFIPAPCAMSYAISGARRWFVMGVASS